MTYSNLPDFCFVIITRNEEKHIISCIESILSQDYDFRRIRIQVVDTGSSDKTVDAVTRYREKLNLENLKLCVLVPNGYKPGFIKAYARNFAVKQCSERCFIVFLDAHTLLPSSLWLKRLAHHVDERTVISGPVIPPPELTPLLRYFGLLELKNVILALIKCSAERGKVFYGGNFSIHRDFFMKAGQFPTVKRSEDLAFLENAQNIGACVISLEDAYVYHLDTRLLRYGEWMKRMFFEGFYSGHIRLTKRTSLLVFFLAFLVTIMALGTTIPPALFILPCSIMSVYLSAVGWWAIKLVRLIFECKARGLVLCRKLLFALLFIGSLQAFVINVGKVCNVVKRVVSL